MLLSNFFKFSSYIVIFTFFNVFISLVYYIFGLIIFRRKSEQIKHTKLPNEQLEYLNEIEFINVKYVWMKEFALKIRLFSICYLILSEIACMATILITERAVLICRMSFFAAVFLLLLLIFLIFYLRKKSRKLTIQHKENLQAVLEDFEKTKDTKQKV